MASNTKNVQLGVCRVYFGGGPNAPASGLGSSPVDLGYTQGGVDVTVKTDTHKVNVDQFGKTPINEYIMGREVTVKCPLAETTLTNLVQIMPGATLNQTGGSYPTTGPVTISGTNFVTGDKVVIGWTTMGLNGSLAASVQVQFATTPAIDGDIAIGATLAASLANLAAMINAQSDCPVSCVATATTLAFTGGFLGPDTQSITLSKTWSTVTGTIPGTLTTVGVNPTAMNVIVPVAIGTSLLSVARTLTLHPILNAVNDRSQDFTVYLAATAGALNFQYSLEKERVYSCEFNGYPDPTTGGLFAIGDLGVAVI